MQEITTILIGTIIALTTFVAFVKRQDKIDAAARQFGQTKLRLPEY